MNSGFRKASHTPTPTVPSIAPTLSWGLLGSPANHTSALAITAKINTPALTSANREVSLAVINTGTMSLSITPKAKSAALSVIPLQAPHQSTKPGSSTVVENVASTSAVKLDTKSDLIVRPTAQLAQTAAAIEKQAVTAPSKVTLPTGSKTSSLNIVVESISQALDYRVKSLRNDLDELVGALDELGQAIRRQSRTTLQQSKGKAKEIREDLEKKVIYRHERARSRAKQLKKKSEAIFATAGEQFKDRTNTAKKRAHDIRKSFQGSDAWRDITNTGTEIWKVYHSAQVEWSSVLQESSKGPGKGGGVSKGCGACNGGSRKMKSSRVDHANGQCQQEIRQERRLEFGNIFNFV
jgi:hypothetical protein